MITTRSLTGFPPTKVFSHWSAKPLLLSAPVGPVVAGVPVSVDVGGAEGVAVVQQRGVDQRVVLGIIHQIRQVAQVTVAASNAVSSAVLVQDEHLTRTEPTLETAHTHGTCQTIHSNESIKSMRRTEPHMFLEQLYHIQLPHTVGIKSTGFVDLLGFLVLF